MKQVFFERFKKINNTKGNIYKLLNGDLFPNHLNGEIYISKINSGEIKAWMMHKKYEALFVVVSGKVKLKWLNYQRELIVEEELSLISERVVKVMPNTWYGFKGISKSTSSILVLINGLHKESEIERINAKGF